MPKAVRLRPAVLGLLALGAVGLLLEQRARAEDPAVDRKAPTNWVYDVRVVRVDSATPATVEVAPSWLPSGAAGATTTATWADLLAGLKARGATTILMDQRVTASLGVPTTVRQDRKRPVMMLRSRHDKVELWDTSYVETGARGELVPMPDGVRYDVDVRWEQDPSGDGTGPVGSAAWKGSHAEPGAGETLVLTYRQQYASATKPYAALEIYVLVTGWPVPSK